MARKESIYKSVHAEPLGRTIDRDYRWPEETKDDQFRFGITSDFSESAKLLLFPSNSCLDAAPKTGEIPGEQKKRDYAWPVDPAAFRFGKVDAGGEKEGVKNALLLPDAAELGNATTIVSATVDDAQRVRAEPLGKGRALGTGDPSLPPSHVFGISTATRDEWNAARLLHGQAEPADLLPDPNLGKSTKVGLRNVDNTGRAIGTPSIRSDVPAPKNKSIADNQNYGNEPNAAGVIQPPKFAPIGVFDEDLLSVLSKEDIKDIVNDAGWGLTDEKFEECYAQAAQMHPSGKVSLEMFRRVYFASL